MKNIYKESIKISWLRKMNFKFCRQNIINQLFNVVTGVLGTLNTTENKGKKEETIKRFSEKSKEIKVNRMIGYK